MPQPAKVCISLNLFAGSNCSWPVSIFSKLLLETCTYVQVELSVRNELRQGVGVDTSFSGGVKSPSSYREVREGCPLQHHDVVSAAPSPPCPVPNLGCEKKGIFEFCICAHHPCPKLPLLLITGAQINFLTNRGMNISAFRRALNSLIMLLIALTLYSSKHSLIVALEGGLTKKRQSVFLHGQIMIR